MVSFFNTQYESKSKHFQKDLSAMTEFIQGDIYQKYFHSSINTYFSHTLHYIFPRLAPALKTFKPYVPHVAISSVR